MKKFFQFFTIFAGLLFLTPAYSATFEQILLEMKDYEAKAKSQVKDMTILLQEKTTTQDRESIRYRLVLRKGEKYRLEQTQSDSGQRTVGGGLVAWPITIFDGTSTWSIDSTGNKTATVFDDWRIHPYLSVGWSTLISPKSTLVNIDNLNGHPAYSIDLPPGWLSLPFTTVWRDIQKPVLVRAKSNRLLVVYSEYQPVMAGVEIPYRVDTFSGGGDVITMTTVKSVEVNHGMNDDLFDPNSTPAKNVRIQELLNRLRLIEEK